MQPIEKLREYADTVCSQIRWKRAHGAVSEEIQNHLIDQRNAYIQEGAAEEEATERAVADMGDPVDVGTQLDRIHRPRPQWSMLALTLVMVVLGMYIQLLVGDDIANRYRSPLPAGIQIEYILVGAAALLVAYFSDFTLIGKYPKTVYFGLLSIFVISFGLEARHYTLLSLFNRYYYLRAFYPMLFPVAFSGIVYAMRGRGKPGIMACLAACFFPAFLALQQARQVSPLIGIVLILVSGGIILGIALTKDWFGSNRRQSWLWTYAPFLGASALAAFCYLRTPHVLRRITAFLHPERDPRGDGYVAMVVKDLLENAKLMGTGTLPSQYAASQSFPLPGIHTDFLLTYLIYRMGWLAFGLVLALLLVFIACGFRLCLKQRSALGQLVSASVLLTFAFQAVHYIGYNLGFLFIAPLSLPLFSYGGAAMVVNLGLIGLMLSAFRSGNAVNDHALLPSVRQPFISWQEHKLIINFGRKDEE